MSRHFTLSAAAFAVLVGSLVLTGCSGVYYNTTFNAEKAHKKAIRLKADRLRLNPDDTVRAAGDEVTQLQRAVIKSSKVLELWPTHPKYAPLAVYRIAECQYLMDDFGSASFKYDEFIRAFPTHERVPMARVRRAQAAFMDGKMLTARESLADAMASSLTGEARREALLLAARLRIAERAEGGGVEALATYEQLLSEGALTSPEGRNEVRWLAANLAFELQQWDKARTYALAANEGTLPVRVQMRNHKVAVLSLYELNRTAEGLAEVRTLLGQRSFRAHRGELKVLEARGVQRQGDWVTARQLYRDATRLSPRMAPAAEAWYRTGLHYLDVAGREDSARLYFDSAATGRQFEFGRLGGEFSDALKRLVELRLMDSADVANRLAEAATASRRAADSLALAARGDSTGDRAVDSNTTPRRDAPKIGSNSQDSLDAKGKRKPVARVVPKPPSVQYAPFMIAELFQFRVPKPDSARKFLSRIISDTGAKAEDTAYTRRAYYALAWLEEEGARTGAFAGTKARADELYRALMARYPGTEWAKAAEQNLGLPATVQTTVDSARVLFLEAERRRFAGENLLTQVKPAYQKVVTQYPTTPFAAKAQFTIAFLTEEAGQQGLLGPRGAPVVDTVKVAYALVRDEFSGTPQATEAIRRLTYLDAAGDESNPNGGGRESGRREDSESVEEDSSEASESTTTPRREGLDDSAEQDLY